MNVVVTSRDGVQDTITADLLQVGDPDEGSHLVAKNDDGRMVAIFRDWSKAVRVVEPPHRVWAFVEGAGNFSGVAK